MADDLVIRKPALYRYAVRLLVDVLYQMGCDMRQTFRVNDTDIHTWNHFTERYPAAGETSYDGSFCFNYNVGTATAPA